MPIITRASKGSPLTHAELDGNFELIRPLVSRAGIVGAPKLRKALASIAAAASQRADIAVQSHSVGIGVSATGGTTYDATNMELWNTRAMFPLMARQLCAAIGGTAATASQSVASGSASPRTTNPLFVVGGGASAASSTWGAGAGGWRIAMTAAAHTVAVKAIGSALKICGVADAAGRQARWNAPSVSAGATQTAAAAGSTALLNGGGVWYEWTITGVTPGETVTLMGPTAGLYTITQIDPDYRTDAGITLHRQCLTGAPAAEISAAYLDNTDTQGPNAAWLGSTTFIQNTRADQARSLSLRPAAMDLVIAMTDVNDLNTFDAAGSAWAYSLADHQRHLSNYLAYHAANSIPVLCVFGPMRDPTYLPGARPYDQVQLIAALKAACDASTNGAYIDLTAPFGSGAQAAYDAQVAAGLLEDIVHPGATGHPYWGRVLAGAILDAAAA